MARTKASVGSKVSSGKSSKARCCAAPSPAASTSSGGGSEKSSRSSSGGNSVCAQPTPKWQRPITNFFIGKETSHDSDDDGASTSTSKKKKTNVIESDDEEIKVTSSGLDEAPKNHVLDETIELQPLTGEDSHKIEEYYPKNGEIDQNGDSNEESIDDKENHPKNGVNSTENDVKGKGKGKGKKTNPNKINGNIKGIVNGNTENRKSVKRDLDEVEESEHVNKKVKVN